MPRSVFAAVWNRAGAGALALLRAAEFWATARPLAFAAVAVLLLLVGTFVLFAPSYDTNDDVFMTMIASGKGFCAQADEHLVFTNVLIGGLLKRLYLAAPQVPWYGLYLLAVHYAAQVAILFCALTVRLTRETGRFPDETSKERPEESSAGFTRLRLTMYLVYFAVVEVYFLNALQFTTTAFLSASAGTVLLIAAWQRRSASSQSPIIAFLSAAVTLLFVAALIRLESLAMVLLLAAPLAVSLLRRSTRPALGPLALAAVALVVLVGSAVYYDAACYEQDPLWRGFFSYNQLRVKFNDFCWTKYSRQTEPVFREVGWSQNDHEMIAHWYFDDPTIYSAANLRTVIEGHPWKLDRSVRGYLWQICRGMLRNRLVWAVLLVLPCFVATIDRRSSGRRVVWQSFLFTLVLMAILTWSTKVLPTRAYFPMLSFSLLLAIVLSERPAVLRRARTEADETSPAKMPPRLHPALAVMLLAGLVMALHCHGRSSWIVRRDRPVLEAFLAQVKPGSTEVYVCWESVVPFEFVSPLDNLAAWSDLCVLPLTWTQQTPLQQRTKRAAGISNLAEAICHRADVVLMATPAHRGLFQTYVVEHLGEDVEFVESAHCGKGLTCGHFRPRSSLTAGAARQAIQR